jgi:hypothetical protein
MRITEILEGKFDYSVKDYENVPFDPTDSSGRLSVGISSKNPNLGPHEGKILNLMLKGMKPAAVITQKELNQYFAPYIHAKKIVLIGPFPITRGTQTDFIVTLPGEEWRGRKLSKIWPKLHAATDPKEIKLIHAKIGKLLGYPKESIRHFIDK